MTVSWANNRITKTEIKTIQINLGNKCNQRCKHCHINASPNGKKNMNEYVAKKILEKLLNIDTNVIEFTGGAPELNPNLRMFLIELSKNGKQTVVRTNLTVLDLPEYSNYIYLYKQCKVKIIASLPSYFKDITDFQRGNGVFEKSIKVLKILNEIGYGFSDLCLDLVYNPEGTYLPPDEKQLEKDYKKILKEKYGIVFNKMITITNSPVGGFKRYLYNQGKFEDYMKLLVNNFNPETLNNIMCRKLLSIDYEGYIYDCDFNLALGIRVKDYEDKRFWEVDLENFCPEITCGEHCYACTVNRGSSCHGVLIKNENEFDVKETVKDYYGSQLKSTSDLKTNACCTIETIPEYIKEILPYIPEEIKERYYGCGSPIPLEPNSLKILDIGCGTGRDCYILSKLAGEEGVVYGIDMTKNQIETAIKYQKSQAERFGFKEPNTHFIYDYIENIDKYFLDNSLDIIVSNCVVNLIEDKEDLLKQIYRILKNGGEFYFSDIYSDRRIPENIRKEPILYNECLGGALYWKDFERLARKVGFIDPRIVSKRIVDIHDKKLKEITENITFFSITYRLWKIQGLEDACEDYGHIAIYRGGIKESPFKFVLDSSHVFEKDKPVRVCGNTALMLSKTRFAKYFHIIGDFSKHFGQFKDCGDIKINEYKKDECIC